MPSVAVPRHPGAWSLPEMAPDQPLLDFSSRTGARQRLRMFVVASEILLNHLDCVEHGLAALPPQWPDPDEGVAERQVVGSLAGQGGAAPANPYARNTVRILARTPGNWAPLLVEDIDNRGRDMLDKAFYPHGVGGKRSHTEGIAPVVSEWAHGSRQVLSMMCPPRRWRDAIAALDKRDESSDEFSRQGMAAARARIEAFALQHPVAAIHAAAAQVAWLSLQPKVVPDWTARRTEIAAAADEMNDKIRSSLARF